MANIYHFQRIFITLILQIVHIHGIDIIHTFCRVVIIPWYDISCVMFGTVEKGRCFCLCCLLKNVIKQIFSVLKVFELNDNTNINEWSSCLSLNKRFAYFFFQRQNNILVIRYTTCVSWFVSNSKNTSCLSCSTLIHINYQHHDINIMVSTIVSRILKVLQPLYFTSINKIFQNQQSCAYYL